MACDCIKMTDEALAKRNEQLRAIYRFDGRPPVLYVETTPIERKRGQKDSKLLLTFCPFCGERYEAEEAAANNLSGKGGESRSPRSER